MLIWRRLLCLVAARLVGFAGVLAAIDKSLEMAPEFISVSLFTMAAAALVLAAWPSGTDWSRRRRIVGGSAAVGSILLGAPVLLATITVAACACGPVGPAYVPPAPLGIDTRHWIFAAVASGPVLLLIATALPYAARRSEGYQA